MGPNKRHDAPNYGCIGRDVEWTLITAAAIASHAPGTDGIHSINPRHLGIASGAAQL
ncbi:hypothetical protein AB0B25_05105 [Nocardia sp. NPDC049190]|uniref:hypothetical protein n=1 Tax=Nocardia sp. NPDC049190 TaxID=3155650 RepID=UPI0033EFE229